MTAAKESIYVLGSARGFWAAAGLGALIDGLNTTKDLVDLKHSGSSLMDASVAVLGLVPTPFLGTIGVGLQAVVACLD